MANIVPLSDLTQTTLDGSGVFDTLMRSMKAHLEAEYQKGRIKGAEYSTVYLGSLTAVLDASLNFLLQREKVALEAELMAQQILVAEAEVAKANAMVLVAEQEVLKAQIEKDILLANKGKIPVEIAHLEAQTAFIGQQRTNLIAEGLNIPKQGTLLDAQKSVQTQQALNLATEKLHIEAQTSLVNQQKTNLTAESLNIPKQGLLIDAQANVQTQQQLNMAKELLHTEAKITLTANQSANAVTEGLVLAAQKCKLDAEFDLLKEQTLKGAAETALLTQKVVTERAQTLAVGVDADSVLGKQKALYQAQTDGFTRDAEQKAAKLMVDSWNVRRTTDEGTVADSTNKLADFYVGSAVSKLLAGVGAAA